MPLYEYECQANGHRFELIRKFSDPPVRTCVHCKSKVRKLISSSAIAFKGSGWYVTDYAGKGTGGTGRGEGSRPDNSSQPKADASSERKTDSGSESGAGTNGADPKGGSSTSGKREKSKGGGKPK